MELPLQLNRRRGPLLLLEKAGYFMAMNKAKSAVTKRAKSAAVRTTRKTVNTSKASATAPKKPAVPGITSRLMSWSDSLISFAGPLTNMSLALTKASLKSPAKGVALKKAAMMLLKARESLGMTAQDVAQAINLKNPELLEQAETGKAALPFEVILRLAAVLGRNDPISFFLKLFRSYYPELWNKLEAIGLGKLVEHAGREREFVNIYRRSDAARGLTDAEFAAVLAFVDAAFIMALTLKQGKAKAR
jgi:transcriptional regulator with XRE-family HTH domain